jgi:hypothetical protein
MSRLDDAVDAILAGQPDRDEWTALCVATVRLGHALAGWDDARRRYIAVHPPPPGGWPWRHPRTRNAATLSAMADGSG